MPSKINNLDKLADIFPGQSIRKGVRNDENGRFSLIQMKDVSIEDGIKGKGLYKINLSKGSNPKLLQVQDILFISRAWRGTTPFSVILKEEIPNLIAAPFFHIIRVKDEQPVLPEYLSWFINTVPYSQKFFKQHAVGTTVLNIPLNVLKKMNIIVPPMKIQKSITEMAKLLLEEKKAFEKLSQERSKLLSSLIQNSMTKIQRSEV